MRFTKLPRTIAAVSVVAAAGLALGACSSSSKADDDESSDNRGRYDDDHRTRGQDNR